MFKEPWLQTLISCFDKQWLARIVMDCKETKNQFVEQIWGFKTSTLWNDITFAYISNKPHSLSHVPNLPFLSYAKHLKSLSSKKTEKMWKEVDSTSASMYSTANGLKHMCKYESSYFVFPFLNFCPFPMRIENPAKSRARISLRSSSLAWLARIESD